MRELTQTVTASAANGWAGNCWQTAVACLLDVDPETMPTQAECDLYTTEGGKRAAPRTSPGYSNRLNAYLRDHHGLTYCELHVWQSTLSFLRVADPGWHLMTGRTVRSDSMGGLRHVVVGRYGEMVWDPHPSHAGLIEEVRWAFLSPWPKEWSAIDVARADNPCVCPACRI